MENVVAGFSHATALASDGPDQLLSEFSTAQVPVIIAGYILMIVYTVITLTAFASKDWRVKSRARIGILGVFLVALSVASGLSIANLAHVPFSAAATQVIPFLMLGLGMDASFVIIRNFPLAKSTDTSVAEAATIGLTGAIPSVVVMSLTNAGVFAIGNLALMPVVTDMATQVVFLLFFAHVFLEFLY